MLFTESVMFIFAAVSKGGIRKYGPMNHNVMLIETALHRGFELNKSCEFTRDYLKQF